MNCEVVLFCSFKQDGASYTLHIYDCQLTPRLQKEKRTRDFAFWHFKMLCLLIITFFSQLSSRVVLPKVLERFRTWTKLPPDIGDLTYGTRSHLIQLELDKFVEEIWNMWEKNLRTWTWSHATFQFRWILGILFILLLNYCFTD